MAYLMFPALTHQNVEEERLVGSASKGASQGDIRWEFEIIASSMNAAEYQLLILV